MSAVYGRSSIAVFLSQGLGGVQSKAILSPHGDLGKGKVFEEEGLCATDSLRPLISGAKASLVIPSASLTAPGLA